MTGPIMKFRTDFLILQVGKLPQSSANTPDSLHSGSEAIWPNPLRDWCRDPCHRGSNPDGCTVLCVEIIVSISPPLG